MKKILLVAAGFVLVLLILGALYVPQFVEQSTNVNIPHEPWPISDEAAELHNSLFIADLHTDTMLWKRNILQRSERGHVDLPRLKAGNVALQVFSATTKSPADQNYEENTADSDNITLLAMVQLWPISTWTSIYERARYQLDKLIDFTAESDGELLLIRSRNDLASLIERRESGDKVVGGIYLIEGAHPLEGDIANLDRLYDQGLRISGLTHFFDNEVGGSLHGVSGEGLTDFGREFVSRANELGVIIDIAHASPKMVQEVLELSTAPMILSHGGVKGVCDTARNLDDDLMQAFAAAGGLFGVGYWEGAVCDVTPDGVAKSIRYAVDLMGISHVALGSDYDGATAVLFDTSEIAALTEAMVRQGFTEDEIRAVMGENAKRFFLANLPEE